MYERVRELALAMENQLVWEENEGDSDGDVPCYPRCIAIQFGGLTFSGLSVLYMAI